MVWFSGDLGIDLIFIPVFWVTCVWEGTQGVVGEQRSHRIEPRTQSNGARTRSSIFCLSEFCVVLLGTLVEQHHTGC